MRSTEKSLDARARVRGEARAQRRVARAASRSRRPARRDCSARREHAGLAVDRRPREFRRRASPRPGRRTASASSSTDPMPSSRELRHATSAAASSASASVRYPARCTYAVEPERVNLALDVGAQRIRRRPSAPGTSGTRSSHARHRAHEVHRILVADELRDLHDERRAGARRRARSSVVAARRIDRAMHVDAVGHDANSVRARSRSARARAPRRVDTATIAAARPYFHRVPALSRSRKSTRRATTSGTSSRNVASAATATACAVCACTRSIASRE